MVLGSIGDHRGRETRGGAIEQGGRGRVGRPRPIPGGVAPRAQIVGSFSGQMDPLPPDPEARRHGADGGGRVLRKCEGSGRGLPAWALLREDEAFSSQRNHMDRRCDVEPERRQVRIERPTALRREHRDQIRRDDTQQGQRLEGQG
jgi:hypothetical protein